MLVGRRGVGGGGQRGGGWPCCGRKGGKNDNAHASQQGGSGGLVAAETGRAFKNAGDCASHGAQGNDTNGLVLSLSMNPSYACAFGPDCYGTLTGSGLLATSTVKIFYTFLDQPGRPIEVDVKADSSGGTCFPSWASLARYSGLRWSALKLPGPWRPRTRLCRPPW